MTLQIIKHFGLEILITTANFLLVCFAMDFKLSLSGILSFNMHDNYFEINYLLYFFLSTLMLLALNAILHLLKTLAQINPTLKMISGIIIVFPMMALLLSLTVSYSGSYFKYTNPSVYLPGLFVLILFLMGIRLFQIIQTKS